MAALEVAAQRSILDAVEQLGGYGYKQSNQFTIGILDLMIQLPNRPTLLLEVKRILALPRYIDDRVAFASPLTPLQSKSIVDMQKATGKAGWIAVYTVPNKSTSYYASYDPHPRITRLEFENRCVTRQYTRGPKLWQVLPAILDPIYKYTWGE